MIPRLRGVPFASPVFGEVGFHVSPPPSREAFDVLRRSLVCPPNLSEKGHSQKTASTTAQRCSTCWSSMLADPRHTGVSQGRSLSVVGRPKPPVLDPGRRSNDPYSSNKSSGSSSSGSSSRPGRTVRSFVRQVRWLALLLPFLAGTAWMLLPSQRPPDGVAAGQTGGGLGDSGAAAVSSERQGGGGARVAVCFFGLTRSLRWTLPSLQSRLLGVLREAGMTVDVFVHTYSLAEVNNDRAGETGVAYRGYVNDFLALEPTRSLVTSQDDFDLVWPNPLSSSHYKWMYPPTEAPDVIRNVFRAYWSMSMSWGLMAQHAVEGGFEYDAVVLARPDVWFHYDVDLPARTFPLPERTVFLPSFDAEEPQKTRKNDRFAYGSMTTMRVVMNRLATFVQAGTERFSGEIDSEWVYGHHLEINNISVGMLDLLVSRIRLTRDIPKYDHRLVEEACESGKDPLSCEMMDAGFTFPVDKGAP